MYYFEKDYIMRLIHGISRMLARMFLHGEIEEEGETITLRSLSLRKEDDYLRKMIDAGRINEAENQLFDLIESSAWEQKQLAALILAFYDYANSRDDEFLAGAGFSREEIISGLEEAMSAIGMEIPEYMRI